MDWQLGLFRFGLLACVIGLVAIFTQFDVVGLEVAIWNHNPTTEAFDASTAVAVRTDAACLAAATQTRTPEHPSRCLVTTPTPAGLPREQAVANVQSFSVAALTLLVAMLLVAYLGIRMARESST